MSTENGHKIRVDPKDLEFIEHAEAIRVADQYKDDPAKDTYVMAAIVWQSIRRTDPTFTYEQALHLKFSDVDIVGDEVPEVLAASYGGPPLSSAELGESVPET